jgi:hypothetical protein
MDVGSLNNDFPIPFVKTGIVSSFILNPPSSMLIFLDGYNNPGFSGGPIVTVSGSNEVTVIGVVSGYRYNDDHIMVNGKFTGLTYRANTGLVIGYGVSEVLTRIAGSPIGTPVA